MPDYCKSCVARVWCAVQIFIHSMDLVTDCSTLTVYWQERSSTVFAMSLLSVLLSLPIGAASYVYQFRLCRGRAGVEDKILTMKLLGILVESFPQLTMNLYLLSYCEQTDKTIQYISGGFSFLAICAGVVHYDVSVREHRSIGPLQKTFILLYRSSYLAARMLAFVYFTYTLSWWTAAVVVAHWGIGLLCVMNNTVETLARSLAFVFLNTFIYIGEFSGVKALFVLLLYVLENMVMIAAAYIVSTQVAFAEITTPKPPINDTTMPFETEYAVDSFNGFAFIPSPADLTSTAESSAQSFYVNEFCLHSNVLPIHVGLNVLTVVACCFYNVSFHYNSCSYETATDVPKEEEEGIELEDNGERGNEDPNAWIDFA